MIAPMGLDRRQLAEPASTSPSAPAVRRADVLRVLRAHERELRAECAVASLALFGSVARGSAGRSSDVDLLVEFARPVGLFHILRTAERVAVLLGGVEVDLVERAALLPALREPVLAEAVDVFGRAAAQVGPTPTASHPLPKTRGGRQQHVAEA
jgi:predicted nucleotidyltransferase